MRDFKGCENFTLVSSEELKDINSVAYVLKHDKTGARIALIANDDENKSFAISFNTPQKDSTGVPHILEHSVLCGSKKFPVKDAMTEVGKGSVCNFLNAYTFPDRTIYPFATVNDKDFHNLLDVYLDACFFPRVYDDKRIFMQEGWHYELEKPNGDIGINGVVYNEMKGAYSSADTILASNVVFSLFPDTQYGVESGGDPEFIPDLSYEDFIEFHKKLYCPSNARIVMYGDIDFEKELKFIDKEYLSKFESRSDFDRITFQSPFEQPVRTEKTYPVSASENAKEATYFSYNVVCSDYKEPLINEVIEAINYALCTVSGSRLEKALYDAGVCKNVYSDFYTETCQKVFSIVAEGCKAEDENRFVSIVEDTIMAVIEEGFDKKALEAAITSQEFAYKEADFGTSPKGVIYSLSIFDDWSYDEDDVFGSLKLSDMYKTLRSGISEGLFEKTLKERILDNNHKSLLVLKPDKDYDKKIDKKLKSRLKAYTETLSKEDLKILCEETKALKEYQTMPDSLEALKTIPTLSLDDIKKDISTVRYEVSNEKEYKEIYSNLPTNDIAYFSLCFAINHIPKRLLYVVGLMKTLLGSLDTDKYTYGELSNEANIVTGGISLSFIKNDSLKDENKTDVSLEIRTKSFFQNLNKTFDLIYEILFTSKFDDKKRAKERIEQELVGLKSYFENSSHAVVLGKLASCYSESSAKIEILSGFDKLKYFEILSKNFDKDYESVVKDIRELIGLIFVKNNMEVVIGCDEDKKQEFDLALEQFVKRLGSGDFDKTYERMELSEKNQAYYMSSQVQYVGLGGNYRKAGLMPTGKLFVLREIMTNDFLWTNVRVKAGAYGAWIAISRNGQCSFLSYRDPNLKKTYDTYEKSVEYLENYPDDFETVERYIISTIGGIDAPASSSVKLYKAYNSYKCDYTDDDRQRERDEILATKPQDIRDFAKYIEAVLACNVRVTVGAEKAIKKERKMFDFIEPLFNS